ncbi:MAG: type 4 prepilin peptidase 1, leader peptidase (prepilin peptidase) / N-methyltransferase [Candidatus Magasanikbacteria bacterium]|nr:type 4 prepilin peptidase 1, leader peptidase (prepilin peptidase) / N-methyltransferase [Candidatus Magasanikbacteria bacterium]
MPVLISLLFGLAIGSFLNAAIFRLHYGLPIWRGRSQCFTCRMELAWHDLLPVASFLLLRGHCRTCDAEIHWQYPVVELVTALLFVLALTLVPLGLPLGVSLAQLFFWWFIFAIFIFLFVYDARYGELPDQITLPAILIAFVWMQMMHWGWQSSLIGGVVGGGFFLAQYLISRGRWVGGGDIRLGFLIGLVVGWPLVAPSFILAYVLGLVGVLILLGLRRKTFGETVPFGTYLIAGALIAIFFAEPLLKYIGRML